VSLPPGSGDFNQRLATSTEEMTVCLRTSCTGVTGLLVQGSETLVTMRPPPLTPLTRSQCPDPQGTGQSLLEVEAFAVRPQSKGQTPLCRPLQAGLTHRGLQLPHESRHLPLHGLPLQGRSQRSADNPQASHSGRQSLPPRPFQENTTICQIPRWLQGSAIGQSRR